MLLVGYGEVFSYYRWILYPKLMVLCSITNPSPDIWNVLYHLKGIWLYFCYIWFFEVNLSVSWVYAQYGWNAQVAELVDAHGSGPCASNGVEVRVFSWAPVDCFVEIIFNKINILTNRCAWNCLLYGFTPHVVFVTNLIFSLRKKMQQSELIISIKIKYLTDSKIRSSPIQNK